jgi:hypothetical protein
MAKAAQDITGLLADVVPDGMRFVLVLFTDEQEGAICSSNAGGPVVIEALKTALRAVADRLDDIERGQRAAEEPS